MWAVGLTTAHTRLSPPHSRYTRAVFLIGLTGGIAAGKSTIANRLAEHGATVLNADEIARDAVAPGTPALVSIANRFGPEVLNSDGSLNRASLGELVFADAQKLAQLNAIVHPAVAEYTRELLASIELRTPDAIVVYDVPLLVEARVNHGWDLVVVAIADAAVRRDRLIRVRGMDPVEADRRIAAQATDEERRAVADVIIDTGSTLAETKRQTDALWEDVQRLAKAKLEA